MYRTCLILFTRKKNRNRSSPRKWDLDIWSIENVTIASISTQQQQKMKCILTPLAMERKGARKWDTEKKNYWEVWKGRSCFKNTLIAVWTKPTINTFSRNSIQRIQIPLHKCYYFSLSLFCGFIQLKLCLRMSTNPFFRCVPLCFVPFYFFLSFFPSPSPSLYLSMWVISFFKSNNFVFSFVVSKFQYHD